MLTPETFNTPDEYVELAVNTAPPDLSQDERLLNAALGLAGEAGEVADMIKKWRFHGHDLDAAKLQKELGDIQWYLALASDAMGMSLRGVMQQNLMKLRARYPEGFDPERSRNRTE
jgi:NTP pyrophosphatase (non-canonical NTP hydrolase)